MVEPKSMALEENRGGNEMQWSEWRRKLIAVRNNPEGNEICWKTIAVEFEVGEQIQAELH